MAKYPIYFKSEVGHNSIYYFAILSANRVMVAFRGAVASTGEREYRLSTNLSRNQVKKILGTRNKKQIHKWSFYFQYLKVRRHLNIQCRNFLKQLNEKDLP